MNPIPNSNYKLERDVLSRVRMVNRLRRLTDPVMLKAGSLFALIFASWFQVSLVDVAANTPSLAHPGDLSYFLYDAFQKTEWGVRGIAVGILMLGGGLLFQAWRNVRSYYRLNNRLFFWSRLGNLVNFGR